MDLAHIKGKDLDDMQKRYPTAYHFLLDRTLRNEYLAVNNELQMLDRQCQPQSIGRKRWLEEREMQLGQLFRLVANGNNSVTIERKYPSEFGDYNGRNAAS